VNVENKLGYVFKFQTSGSNLNSTCAQHIRLCARTNLTMATTLKMRLAEQSAHPTMPQSREKSLNSFGPNYLS